MKIDRAKQIGPRLDEVDQRREPPDVNRQPGRREEAVVQQPG